MFKADEVIAFFTGEREFPSYITSDTGSEALSSDEQPHRQSEESIDHDEWCFDDSEELEPMPKRPKVMEKNILTSEEGMIWSECSEEDSTESEDESSEKESEKSENDLNVGRGQGSVQHGRSG